MLGAFWWRDWMHSKGDINLIGIFIYGEKGKEGNFDGHGGI